MVSTREVYDEAEQRAALLHRLLSTERARKLTREWCDKEYAEIEALYSGKKRDPAPTDPKKLGPKGGRIYNSLDEALESLKAKASILEAGKAAASGKGSKALDVKDVVDILIHAVAMTVDVTDRDHPMLLTYDYDNNVYTYSDSILVEYIVTIMGSTTETIKRSVIISLMGRRREMAVFTPLPNYKVAVGNGIYNFLTNELEDNDPRYTVTEKIDTDYKPDTYDPATPMGKNRTFEKLCADLSNHEPDRIQLLKQICKAVVTGHSVAPAMFIIMGRGGDGKSTFFQMLVNVIGENNTGFVNFSEIKKEDKMAQTVGKKLVLGMDNNANEYIKDTALLKSMSAHEYITHSRKYEKALSVRFSGTFVQLCNEMPRFAETGDSIARRVVCLHALNSHYREGSEDRTINVLIEQESFKEHVLHSILDENLCGFYSDYNDIDRELIRTTLDNEDMLAQFIDEMVTIGALSSTNVYIPTTHLYAVYRDWLKSTSPNSTPLSNPSFVQRVGQHMDGVGYSISPTLKSSTPSALERNGAYTPNLFSSYSHGPEMEQAKESNAISRVFERTHEPKAKSDRRRGAKQISALEFFGRLNEFSQWLVGKDDQMYEAINDPMDKAALIDSSFTPERAIEQPTQKSKVETPEHVKIAREREKITRMVSNELTAPLDPRKAHREDDVDGIRSYGEWLVGLFDVEDASTTEHQIMVTSTIERHATYLNQIALAEKDSMLQEQAKQVMSANNTDPHLYIREFIDTLTRNMKRRNKA